MKAGRLQKASLVLVALGFVLPAALYSRLPAEFPIHWNWQGHVDAYSGKPIGPFLLPVVNLLLYLMLLVLPKTSPREFAHHSLRRIYDEVTLLLVTFMFFISGLIVLVAMGMPVPFNQAILMGLGALFSALGWLMPRFTMNRLMGIRTPWTYASDDIWKRTHRFGGTLFMAAGLFTVASAFVSASLFPAIAAIAIAAVLPMGYSLLLYWQAGNSRGS